MLHNSYFSTLECSELLEVSRVTIFRWIKSGKIAAEKYAGGYVVSKEELEKFKDGKKLDLEEREILDGFVERLLVDYSDFLYFLK